MNKENAKKIVESALKERFDDHNFYTFISNLLKTPDLLHKPIRNENINEQFKAVISECLMLGHYKDDQKNKIDILKVILHTENSLDKARTTQRNFIANYLKDSGNDAAIVAFISPETSDWRLSLVKLEYIVEVENNQLRSKNDLTPAKRWSFLVGKNEGCHTAISRFVPILESDIKPNLDEVQNAFNIEQVTDEFYRKYKDLFLRMKEGLDELVSTDENIKNDFHSKNIKTEDFAKKTMGQLAFIYFLQKKGWFGVKPKEKWGSGSKTFLRDLFKNRQKYGNNYFNDVLEFFFYEALSQDRGNDEFYKKFDCRIPFLNGGLFEPMNNYSWETTDIILNDNWFSNTNETSEGDTGDGILDVFDRYNFTVNESEPLEKEVAVDPEMLGKVFENLLGVIDRKSKGAFYTPREIVHYICQESLILHLNTDLNGEISLENIRNFISKGTTENLNQNFKLLDDALKNIKICDPAVGSGAFMLGMLNEIVKARQLLNSQLKTSTSKYQLKLEAISNSLYGVDLDSGAIEIAKLRMWLSLAVDEDEPKPLPNLDHKLMQGNSLVSKFYGNTLFDDEFLVNAKLSGDNENIILKELNVIRSEYLAKIRKDQIVPKIKNEYDKKITYLEKKLKDIKSNFVESENLYLFEDPNIEVANSKINDLKNKVKIYLSTSNRTQKENLKKDIDSIKWDLIELSLADEIDKENLVLIKTLRKKNEKPFFIWKLEFNEIFTEKDGFDIVIGNPPYVQIQKFSGTRVQEKLEAEKFQTFSKTGDLYCLFYERGLSLLKSKGILAYITSNKWMRAGYGEILRNYFLNFNPVLLINLGPNVFKSATVDTNILFIQNSTFDNTCKGVSLTTELNKLDNFEKIIIENTSHLNALNQGPWSISSKEESLIFDKIKKNGRIIKDFDIDIYRGILTGLNEAFIINDKLKNELITNDPNCAEILKPLIKGRDIQKYTIQFSDSWLISTFPSLDIDIENFPSIKEYLLSFGKALEQTGEEGSRKKTNRLWFEVQDNIAYWREFEKEKIVWGNISYDSAFSLSGPGFYLNAPGNLLTSKSLDLKFILGCLNSKLFNWEFKRIGIFLGKAYEWKKQYIEQVHLPLINTDNNSIKDTIIEAVNNIITLKLKNAKSDISHFERIINQSVYVLYNLSENEINFIEAL